MLRRRTPFLVCVLLLALAAPLPAAAALVVPELREPSRLRLTLSGAESDLAWIRGVELLCPGEAPGHRAPQAACAALAQADGDPGRLPGSGAPCPEGDAPVTATAQGQWQGRPIHWRADFSSACAVAAHTGAVFAF